MISLRSVAKAYRTAEVETLALADVSLEVTRGEFLAVMGPSGSGKSTLLNVIGLLDAPTAGEYILRGDRVNELGRVRKAVLRNRMFGFIFQTFNLIEGMSAVENVELPLLYRGTGPGARRRAARTVLEALGLGERLFHRPSQLSGGQRQRIAIARALVSNPECILADEPTGSLDSAAGAEILALLGSLARDYGKTVLMVTHDPRAASGADRIVFLRDGRIVDETTPGSAESGVTSQ